MVSAVHKKGDIIYLFKHVLAELKLLHQALAAVLHVHSQQSLVSQLLLSRDQACLQLKTAEVNVPLVVPLVTEANTSFVERLTS